MASFIWKIHQIPFLQKLPAPNGTCMSVSTNSTSHILTCIIIIIIIIIAYVYNYLLYVVNNSSIEAELSTGSNSCSNNTKDKNWRYLVTTYRMNGLLIDTMFHWNIHNMCSDKRQYINLDSSSLFSNNKLHSMPVKVKHQAYNRH